MPITKTVENAVDAVLFFADLEIADAQVNLIVVDSLTSHLRPTLEPQTRRLLNDLIRSTLATICSSRRVSVRTLSFRYPLLVVDVASMFLVRYHNEDVDQTIRTR